ncbi:MAG: 16S rRNA (cytosine(1402)-N(4))-methyltransferase RsmH [Pyrinomonadaceae bacterium MAG19_C2-C3]|nr:16S rRNA (cytosine(1402)-N(4))-methyltransferase RsmH [Pyrinomonadaceae bacterium MAG19_C2-C3]
MTTEGDTDFDINGDTDTDGDVDFDALHRSVMLSEVLEYLAPERGGLFIDATLGLGGHTEAILENNPTTRVIGIDRDPDALRHAAHRLARFGTRFRFVKALSHEIADVLASVGESKADGVLADLGVSSWQFDTAHRGFSFRFDAPLDMRMDAEGDDPTAADLLAELPEVEIARIIYEYGEEPASRRIARRIVERRERGEPVTTTVELANLVAGVIRYRAGKSRRTRSRATAEIHPATRTFQALRIAVNGELDDLAKFVESSIEILNPRGRFVCISFHSLEDRIIKRTLRRLAGGCECDSRLPMCECGSREAVQILTRRPVTPDAAEARINPRARSAKLRACQRL